jgi:hypothetical protein
MISFQLIHVVLPALAACIGSILLAANCAKAERQ